MTSDCIKFRKIFKSYKYIIHMKRGISPLIASIFLFGFAIVIGVIVLMSSTNLNQNIIEDQDRQIAKAVILDLDASHSPDVNCTQLWSVEPRCDTGATNYYCILIENEENRIINYMVKTKGGKGTEVCSPNNFELQPYQSKVFAVGYNNVTVGADGSLLAEVEAVLFLD
jgi:hypothetical protein